MDTARIRNVVMVGGSGLVAITSFATGILFLVGQDGSLDLGGRPFELGVGVTLLVAGGAVVTGLWNFSGTRRSGSMLVAIGALPVAICFWWTGVVPAVAIPVAITSVVRGRRHQSVSG